MYLQLGCFQFGETGVGFIIGRRVLVWISICERASERVANDIGKIFIKRKIPWRGARRVIIATLRAVYWVHTFTSRHRKF